MQVHPITPFAPSKCAFIMLLGIMALSSYQLAACSVIENKIKSQINAHPGGDNPGTTPSDDHLAKTVSINAVRPNQGEVGGGTTVEIVGIGFAADSVVAFGDTLATNVQLINATTLRVVTPAHAQPGVVGVTVQAHPNATARDQATQDGAFTYYVPVQLERIDPSRVPTQGGTLITVYGAGLIEGTTARFGNTNVMQVLHIDDSTIALRAPPLPRGVHTLTVSNVHGQAALAGALTAFEPVTLQSVTPFAVPNDQTVTLTAHGTGLSIDSVWSIQPHAQDVATTPSPWVPLNVIGNNTQATQLTGTLAAQPAPLGEGLWDVHVENSFGSSDKMAGIAIYDPNNTTLRIIGTTPRAAMTGAATEVTIAMGGGLTTLPAVVADPNTVPIVHFGDQPGQDCHVVDAALITCLLTAADQEGSVDIDVQIGDTHAVLSHGFAFIDLRVEHITPDQIAIAGGTRVSVEGHGFGADSRVFVNDMPATDVVVEDAQHLVFRAPRGQPGRVPLRLETNGVAVRIPDALTYFDPANTVNWTSGHAINGTVNVTVIDDATRRIAGAYVILDHANPAYRGITDERGQITFSGADIVGPVSVHAGKPNYGAFSWIQIDSEFVTLGLTAPPPPPPEPLPECPQRMAGGPALIEGTVRRIKDEFNTGRDQVIVTTTQSDLSTPLPSPGVNAQLTSQGPYALWARSGDLVVLAMAGGTATDGRFAPHALGFAPFMTLQPSTATACTADTDCSNGESCRQMGQNKACTRVYSVDIVIDTPLTQTLTINLDNPPLGDAPGFPYSGADTSSAFIWYDFHQWGVHALYPRLNAPASNTLYANMPRALPATLGSVPFHVRGGVYRGTSNGTPWSEVLIENNYDTTRPVTLSPLLKTLLLPNVNVADAGDLTFDYIGYPTDRSDPRISANFHGVYDIETVIPCRGAMPTSRPIVRWYVITPGNVEQFALPRFPEAAHMANIPAGLHYWQLMAIYTPGVRLNNLSLRDLFASKSNALNATSFVIP